MRKIEVNTKISLIKYLILLTAMLFLSIVFVEDDIDLTYVVATYIGYYLLTTPGHGSSSKERVSLTSLLIFSLTFSLGIVCYEFLVRRYMDNSFVAIIMVLVIVSGIHFVDIRLKSWDRGYY